MGTGDEVNVSKPQHEALEDKGLSADEIQLRAQGHVATFVTPAFAGAGPAIFWAPIVAFMACLFITLGLAELASAFPSTGGQYHFAFMVAPKKFRAPIAFATGWLSCFAWLFTTAAGYLFLAQCCVNLATLMHPEYVWTRWQAYLVYCGFIIVITAIVILLPRRIPMGESVFFWTSVIGFVVSTIAMLAVSDTKQSSKVVFTKWVNQTGWSDGTAFLLAVGQAMYGFLCTDAATHISEELPNPSRNVPRAMWGTILVGIITVLPFTLAFLFSVTDLEAVSLSLLPIMEVYSQAFQHRGAAFFFTFWILFIYFGATIGLVVTSGRLLWAFARDGGLPFSKVFARTHPTLKVPVYSTLLTAAFCMLYGLIYIGSTTAFNSFVATAILSLNITYTIPQFMVLLRGRKNVLPARSFDLGPIFGAFCNIFSTAWVALYAILFCFPIFLPVEAVSMNYVIVVMAGTALFIALTWWLPGGKRGRFTGPNVDIEMLDAVNRGQVGGREGVGDEK
ncbi:hypothetical protein LTR37_002258 [Vermiconidia calcicola]|uniref:Uncharacterized protein n=1 Tax=Vermiconidia calcicola TaxID=1690605 RepID=A0ACC3NUT8_9PEZI|nr:hypothetical protein LTR37_002258 [Vermiconidia calcicola]